MPSWQRSMIPPAIEGYEATGDGRWLIFIDDIGVGQRLAERLERSGAAVVTVSAGTRFERIATNCFVIDPGARALSMLTELTNAGWRSERIVHLRELMPAEHASPAEELEQASTACSFLPRQSERCWRTPTCGSTSFPAAVTTSLGPNSCVQQRLPLWGSSRSFPRSRRTSCRSVDLDFEVGGPASDDLIECLHDELTKGGTDGVVAYRGRHRWKPWFEPIRVGPTTPATSRLKTGGTALAGGLGGVGTIGGVSCTRVQSETGPGGQAGLPAEARFPLAPAVSSWDPVTARRIRNVEMLELGADVLVLSADVGDEVQMEQAVAAARRQFGRIDGVIHAAGVTEGDIVFNPLDDTTRGGAETIFRSKVHGLAVLARSAWHRDT